MIRLRPAEPQDDRVFFLLRKEIEPELKWEQHEKWWAKEFEHRFVAYDGPATVGIIRISRPEGHTIGFAEGTIHLQVAKAEQRKGLGTQMLTVIQRVARDLGFIRLRAQVACENIPSQKAFEGAGFQPTQFEVKL